MIKYKLYLNFSYEKYFLKNNGVNYYLIKINIMEKIKDIYYKYNNEWIKIRLLSDDGSPYSE